LDVSAWLTTLGFAQYADGFAANDIDAATLRALTAEDLRELGVQSLGHRKRLLAAIAALDQAAPAAAPLLDERRLAAVLFVDLAGFTRLSAAADAEEVHALLERFFTRADGIIGSFGGAIDKHIGDCTMAVFGAPVAHGDDLERAVRAALAVREAMGPLSRELGRDLAIHAGIAMGTVVAAGTGSDIHRTYTVTGDAVNLASRLTDLADDGEILLSDEAVRILGHAVQVEDAGAHAIAGFEHMLQVWRVLGLPAQAAGGAPFVGRNAELQQLVELAQSCRTRDSGAIAYLRGEAGIGKSRLATELGDRIAADGFAVLRAGFLDFGGGELRDGIRTLAARLAGIDPGADEGARAAAADRITAAPGFPQDHAQHVFALLAAPLPERLAARLAAMDDAARRSGARAALAALVGQAVRRPMLLVVEDLHWADPAALDLLAGAANALNAAPGLLVLTARAEADPLDHAWRARLGALPLVTIDLGPLPAQETERLATLLVGGDAAAGAACAARANGHPLFLEQLARHAGDIVASALPGSIHNLVLARLDRLASADRRVVQAAACLGQRFDLAELRFLIDDAQYQPNALVAALLLRPEGEGYAFHHALIRDGAYASLLAARKRELHARAASWYAERDPALHAEHLDRAGDRSAARAYRRAAEVEAARFRYDRAASLAQRGLARTDDPAERFALCCLDGEMLRELGQAGASIAAYEDAQRNAPDDQARCRALIGAAAAMRIADRIAEALSALEQAEAIATRLGLTEEQARIHHLRGNLFFPLGRVSDCAAEHQSALGCADRVGSAELAAQAFSGLGDAAYAQGRVLASNGYFREAVKLAERHGLVRIEVANRNMMAVTQALTGPVDGVLADAEAAIAAAMSVGHHRAAIVAHHAAFFALFLTGQFAGAQAHAEQADAITMRIGATRFHSENLSFLASAVRLAGDRARALELAREAWDSAEKTGPSYFGPAVLGELLRSATDPAERELAVQRAEALLAKGGLAHNHWLFRSDAIEAALEDRRWDEADRHAQAFAQAFAVEVVPSVAFLVRRAHLLAAHGRGAADHGACAQAAEEGRRLGYLIYVPALEAAARA
jgi:class 3 adenylate cyclase/tetratricopeptide (TPR) repeat protein